MSLPEQLQQLDRQIADQLARSFAQLRSQMAARLRQSSADLLQALEEAVPELPATVLAEDELAPLVSAQRAGARGEAFASLHEGIAAIDRGSSQSEILSALLTSASGYCSRAALLLTRPERVEGWAAVGFSEEMTPLAPLSAITELALAYGEEDPWSRLAEGHGCVSLDAGDCARLVSQLDSPLPENGLLIPLVLRDRIAAGLYADRTAPDEPLDLAALQLLTYAAAQAIELLALRARTSTPTLRLAAEAPAGEPGLALWEPGPVPVPEEVPAAMSWASEQPAAVETEFEMEEVESIPLAEITEITEVSEISEGGEATGLEAAEAAAAQDLWAPQAEIAEEEVTEPEAVPPPAWEEEGAEPSPFAWEEQGGATTGTHVVEREPEPALEAPPAAPEQAPWEAEAAATWEEETSPGTARTSWEEEATPLAPAAAWEPEPTPLAPAPAWEVAPTPATPAAAWEEEEAVQDAAAAPSAEIPQTLAPEPALQEPDAISPPEPIAPPPPLPAIGFGEPTRTIDLSEDETVMIARPVATQPVPAPPLAPLAPLAPVEPPPALSAPPATDPYERAARPSGRTTSEVLPPPDLQGPGWAFSTARIPVASGDEALHEEARRLARLLVSEIKLYNEEQVEEGRRNRDIYQRLKEDIDRSRQLYDERVHERIRTTTDYFYQELVRNLGGGDSRALGM